MTWEERWERMDPAEVLERKQQMQARRPSKDAALARIERLFAGEDMAREMDFRLKIGPELHERLENWGRIMRVKERQGRSPTADICHRLAVQAGKIKEVQKAPPDEAKLQDAFEIERAWRNPLMPRRAKAMLRGFYVFRMHPNSICRSGGIRYAEFDAEMWKACCFLTNMMERLAFRAEAAHNPQHNLSADTHSVAE
ncbi:hypothetical protein CAL14_08425 [Bordetella genomosp. 9]|uniref:hypothetical protein n=1 Tax=Bordetella genomosp. 9 TaxID=1416803 RepID=UPI000A292C7C|nr:hypothetical protein [Bordetella genomosp. 9]ARP90307.1 hypothetical protein CAL14_08425 [Bordetella genomosp. 9]